MESILQVKYKGTELGQIIGSSLEMERYFLFLNTDGLTPTCCLKRLLNNGCNWRHVYLVRRSYRSQSVCICSKLPTKEKQNLN